MRAIQMHKVQYGVDRIDQMIKELYLAREYCLEYFYTGRYGFEIAYRKKLDRLERIREYLLKRLRR